MADGPLIPLGQAPGKTDATGALAVTIKTRSGVDSPYQNALQINVRVDDNGNLLIANG